MVLERQAADFVGGKWVQLRFVIARRRTGQCFRIA
jgi:hypothetical protein